MQVPSKHYSILFYSSTLEGALSTLKLKYSAFSGFFGDKDQQRTEWTTTTMKNIFHLHNGQYSNWHAIVKNSSIKSTIVNLLFITCKQLLSALKTSKKSISYENLGFCIVSVS